MTDPLTNAPEPIWDGEHGNTFDMDLGTWDATIFLDHEPTDQELIKAVTDRVSETIVDMLRHWTPSIQEITFVETECFFDRGKCPVHD